MSGTLRSLYEQLLSSVRSSPDPSPRASAAIVLWRKTAAGLEIYWMRRAATMPFMGGWWAFPGGGISKSDAAVPFVGRPEGASETSFTQPLPELTERERAELGPDLCPGLLAGAARELFEEVGVLLTPAALPAASLDGLAAARHELLAKQLDFAGLLERERLTLDVSPLVFAGRWLTPPLSPLRFDNRFFLLEWGAEKAPQPTLEGGEHDVAEWIAPAAAVARWERGEVITAPPILHLLRVLAESDPEAALERLRNPVEANLGALRRIEFRPGVLLLPLRTRTLLPATRTNTYLLGTGETVLIDPAPTDRSEIDQLRRAVAAAAERLGRKVSAIWLTHHHRDHVGAVGKMRRELKVPVFAHELARAPLDKLGIELDGTLEDGQRIVLGGDPPFPLQVLHTPGHTPGHLAFFDETHGSLIAGDLVAGVGTIVIDPPEGDMEAYLRSLERAIELGPHTVFPAHGPPLVPAVGKLHELREHRLRREQKVLDAWRNGKKTPGAMVAEVYDDAPKEVHPIAERQIAAHLARLERLGMLD